MYYVKMFPLLRSKFTSFMKTIKLNNQNVPTVQYSTVLYYNVSARPRRGQRFHDRALLYYNMSARGEAEAFTKSMSRRGGEANRRF